MKRDSVVESLTRQQSFLKRSLNSGSFEFMAEVLGRSVDDVKTGLADEIAFAESFRYLENLAVAKRDYLKGLRSKSTREVAKVIIKMRIIEVEAESKKFPLEEARVLIDGYASSGGHPSNAATFFSGGIETEEDEKDDIYVAVLQVSHIYMDTIYLEKERIFGTLGLLENKKTDKRNAREQTVEKLERLVRYARVNDEAMVASYAAIMFPEWTSVFSSKIAAKQSTMIDSTVTPSAAASHILLPSSAPALWKADKLAHETPPDFIKRIYSEWLGNGLDRATVRRLDPPLGQALDNWLRKNEMPADVDLPTAKERTTREIERLKAASETGDIKDVVGSFTLREAQRIEANIRRHERMKK